MSEEIIRSDYALLNVNMLLIKYANRYNNYSYKRAVAGEEFDEKARKMYDRLCDESSEVVFDLMVSSGYNVKFKSVKDKLDFWYSEIELIEK